MLTVAYRLELRGKGGAAHNRIGRLYREIGSLDDASQHLQTALALFKTDTGRFPTTSEGLETLVTNPGIENYDSEGYLPKVPLDPWGHPYVYLPPGLHDKDYDLESYGKDGEDGGTGDDADIESWDFDS